MLSLHKKISSSITKSKKLLNITIEHDYKQIIIGLVFCVVIALALWGIYCWYINKYTLQEVPTMKRPFLNMWGIRKDGSEFLTNIVCITHPFTRDECIVQYNDAKNKGVHFLGLSSYSEFPGEISNSSDILHDRTIDAWTKYDYFKLTRGWLSCFSDENNKKWIKQGFPCINITESDFANYEQHQPDPNVKKEYDFIYICLKDGVKKEGDKDCPIGWQAYNRNYEKAKAFLDIMCKKYKLKGLLVGRIGCQMPPNCHNLMELTDFMEYSTFIKQYNRCKFIFAPNLTDASPRCVSEAICFNLPVLMNSGILGGWQYISKESGELFDANKPEDFEPILENFLKKLNNSEYKPREWFIQNYGKYNSGKKLKKFIGEVFKPEEINFKIHDFEYLKPGI